MKIRDPKTKEKFIQYLKDHPEERFWQAVRNFSGYDYIQGVTVKGNVFTEEDTFYIEADEDDTTKNATKRTKGWRMPENT